jgi:hypothetical protein
MLQRNNSMVKLGVSQLPHPMMHDNNYVFCLIQEDTFQSIHVFMDY